MILFLISIIPVEIGLRIDYCTIDHFNNHFQFLENKASTLGWNGSFSRFGHFLYSPILETHFITIENFSTSICFSYFHDKNEGNFAYNTTIDTFRLREIWSYWQLPIDVKLNLNIGPIIFTSGFEFSYTKLTVDAQANYQMNENYPRFFDSFDIGLFAGFCKDFKMIQLQIFYNYARIDQFHNREKYLYYDENEGYIYTGPENHGDPSAVLNHSGIGVNILYRLF
ncbi:MAG: hypothetical protein ABIL22_05020 [candidate division WOR-3 bacterium]